MKFDSPLRYPGGKASLAPFLSETITINNLYGCCYFEPFAGGAGAALRLLRQGIVSQIHLNDLDPRIVSFWRAILDESERFAEYILSVPITIEEWKKQLQICRFADSSKPFELGFSVFFLNRCNRSGIILGSAPIGGYDQSGKWKMDARFYRETLANRVLAIARRKEQIHVSNMDALDFLSNYLAPRRDSESSFVYLDPPYYSNGNRLYMNSYKHLHHRDLARYIQETNTLNWVMSYDDTEFIRDLYATAEITTLPLQYSLQRRRRAQELLISPSYVRLGVSSPPKGKVQ